jgi:serine/threonine protein kinase
MMKSEMVEKLPADLFQTSRRMVSMDRSVQQIPPVTALQHLDAWIGRALEALEALHKAGLRHGDIDLNTLRIDPASMTLRLGGVLTAFYEYEAPPQEPFDSHNLVAPPERLFWDGYRQGRMFSEMMLAIEEENPSYEMIPAILPQLPYTRATYQQIYESIQSGKTPMADIWGAGDVWMLGFSLLRYYEELMAWPYVMSSEFYRTRHEQFMELLGRMLSPLPNHRITAVEAVGFWIGTKPTSSDDDDDESDVDNAESASTIASTTGAPTIASTTGASTTGASTTGASTTGASTTETPVPPRQRRLVLNVHRDPAGRSKTRRSPRS